MTISRGNGYLVPLLFVLAIVPSAISKVHVQHQLVPLWWLLGAIVVVAIGIRDERRAAANLERPLYVYEHVFDLALHRPMPFSSFMLVQMKWWAIGFVLAAAMWIRHAA